MILKYAISRMLNHEHVSLAKSFPKFGVPKKWFKVDDILIQSINLDSELTLYSESVGDLLYDVNLDDIN